MWIKYILILTLGMFYLLTTFSCGPTANGPNSNKVTPQPTVATGRCPEVTKPFPSYENKDDQIGANNFGPPDPWCEKYHEEKDKGLPVEHPIFQLSQEYPSVEPANIEQPWKIYDFKVGSEWKSYLKEVLKYAYEGNIEADWVVQENTVAGRKWYHAPWMHTGARGREFVHGMTSERCSCADELNGKPGSVKGCVVDASLTKPAEAQCHPSTPVQNWAVSVYNEPGGYFLKQVWDEVQRPEPDPERLAKLTEDGFPEGTITIKLLFTTATDTEAGYLKNSPVWKADICRAKANPEGNPNGGPDRDCRFAGNPTGIGNNQPVDMRLLQIDVAVRDKDSPIGWVFGSFVYNDNAPALLDTYSPPAGKESWLRMEPIGIMFGNDPQKPIGDKLAESFINSELGIAQHLGCGGRLDGPVDNLASSCIACHAFSETPQNLAGNPSLPHALMRCGNQKDVDYWMRNIDPRSTVTQERTFTDCAGSNPAITPKPGEKCIAKPEGIRYSLDYSLQLREGIRRYCTAFPAQCKKWTDLSAKPSPTPKVGQVEAEISRDGVTLAVKTPTPAAQ